MNYFQPSLDSVGITVLTIGMIVPYLVGFVAAAVADFRKWRNKR